ncbi:hypothetical protein MK805_14170 [Shimazuella sp. AN120528]|uniref:hypothetical protein n=1 Tax=Shimazuella soli TaxID=1892854 RepID=UPI001F0E7D04|nr:hypothetical protein [Shimazuella soli]MCH5586084.1 hypothetical protein [Shimazuella soli]
MITKLYAKNKLTPDELSYLEKLVKECILFLTKHLLYISSPISNPSSNREYIKTANQLNALKNLKEKFQLRKLERINTIEFQSLTKLVDERLETLEFESQKLSFEAAFAKRLERIEINKLLDENIEEEIKLKIIQSKLQP